MSSLTSLWMLFFVSMVCVIISKSRNIYNIDENGREVCIFKDKFFYYIATIIMSLFIGLRLWCNDTGTYRETYDYLISATGPILDGISWDIGDSPAFAILNTILKHIGFSSQSFLMFYAVITVALYMWFLHKYSSDFAMSVFLLWTMGVYLFAAAGMRQAVAIAIGLLGIDAFFRRKYIAFVLWIAFAALFHPYVLLFLLTPIMTYSPWTSKTAWMFGIFALMGVTLQSLVGTLLSLTTMMGKNYDSDAFSGEGVNVFRLLVVWAPILLSFLIRQLMKESSDICNNLFMNFSMLNASIMFVALFGTANYFARLANYFLIFQTMSLPWMIEFFDYENKKLLNVIIVICYLLYFVFAYMILTPFNSYFAKMTITEYMSSIFK